MDFKEKLEKAANQYEEESIYGGMEALYDTKYAFKQGAEWLQSQPLADRLTEEEREKIKAKYNELKSLNSITNEMFSDDTAIFEWLFGKEMFLNKE